MHVIPESELILNADSKVYHLNTGPHDLARTILTVGDPDRVATVSACFDSVEFKTQHREFVTHTGYVGKKRITVLSSGIGPDNIDIVMNELDACFNIDFHSRTSKPEHQSLQIIRLGTSGSLQADIPVDSLVVSTHGIGLDNLLHYYPFEASEEEQQIAKAFSAQCLPDRAVVIPYAAKGSGFLLPFFTDGFHQGITVTCPGFYGPQGRNLRAGLQYPSLVEQLTDFRWNSMRITNFEMETAAIFGLGKLLGHHCLAINTIVANRVRKEFSQSAPKSIQNMIERSLSIIETIPDEDSIH
ncbi:MAG TPA: nucleoside phosphorylase [Chitinophagaceae bacterium]|nr:nucleoside phosphorylase [Chitinophagaceae bacterium]